MTAIICVSCDGELTESDTQYTDQGDTYCEGCFYEEEEASE